MKVVLVEDDRGMLLIAKKMLSQIAGVEIEGAFQSSRDAYPVFNEKKIDMVFIDINLQGECGFDLAKRLLSQYPDLKLVFLTASREYALDAFDIYAFDYIVKPVTKERLLKTVQRALDIDNNSKKNKPEVKTVRMEVYCFGGLEVRTPKGEMIRWISSKSAELFAYLLINRGRCVLRSKILQEVFADMPVKNAETYLNTAVYQLRKSLEPFGLKDIVLSHSDGYIIDMDKIYVDFIDFEERVRSTVPDIYNLDKALDTEKLFSGELFEDRGYSWDAIERERFSELYAEYAKKLSVLLIETGSRATALVILKKLISRNVLDEQANCLLMKLYAAQKEKTLLLSLYDHYVKALKKELGVKPGRNVVNLYAELRKSISE